MTIYTAIFSNYDQLKEPVTVTPGWDYVCFTDQDLKSKVWKIIKVPLMPGGAQRTARFYKIMFHKHIEDSKSIWIDASFKINCDLDRWMRRMSGPFTVVRHPERDCVYDEILACIERKKDNPDLLVRQYVRFLDMNFPKHNGLISSGVMMREATPSTIEASEFWYKELCKQSVRDQLSLAYTMWSYNGVFSVIDWNYMSQQEFILTPHNKPWWTQRL